MSRIAKAKRVFIEALDLPEAERAAFVERECAGDAALRGEVGALLAVLKDGEAFLSSPTAHDATPTADHDPLASRASGTGSATDRARQIEARESALREKPGTRIGPYRLLQEIGEGGFGSVFMAEQERPVQRKVALKIIKLGMDTHQVVARFEQERQALALMDHPNIAKVFDAGATETGRPYFVMELVKGQPITSYCDAHKLTISQRLELLAQVCLAVQHAHQKGVIHRDIKPSNVLVSMQDGRHAAKIIDFGIAKATLSKLTEKTLFTQHQQIIGTPEYMSPEQAGGSLDIDTRTDVYSLGVLLYELLTGTTPFGGEELRSAAYAELQRIIREVEPPTPSTRLSKNTETLAGVAAHRGVEPKRLGTLVRGELDWIVMKALEKDRQRRYESATSLAADIHRYLGGQAVEAAPPGAAYRLRKFVRRHKGVVGAGAAVAAALVLGVAGFAWQAQRVAEQRDAAELARAAERMAREKADTAAAAESAQRAAAETSARTAQAINDFLITMLGSANVRAAGRNATVAQAMERAAADVAKSFKDDPEIEASVRLVLGKTYSSIGMLDEAEPQLARGIEIATALRGEESAPVAQGLTHMAYVKSQRGDNTSSADLGRRAVEIATKVLGPEHPLTLSARGDHANALDRLGRKDEAERMMRETLAIRERVLGPDNRDSQILLNSLGVVVHGQGRLDEAEALYREAEERGRRILAPDDPDLLTVRLNLGSLLRSRGKLAEAEPIMVEAYEGTRRVYGDAHVKTSLAGAVVARLYEDMGRFKEAIPHYEESVAILERAQGKDSIEAARRKRELAPMLSAAGEHGRAMTMAADASRVLGASLGAENLEALRAQSDEANVLMRANRLDEAEVIYKQLLEVCPRVLGEEHSTSVIVINSYGVLLMNQGRFVDAEPLVRRAFDIGRRAQGKDDRATLISQMNLMVVLREGGRLEEAESLGRDLIERAIRSFGARHANLATMRNAYAEVLLKRGRREEARAELVEAIVTSRAAMGDRHEWQARTGVKLAALMIDSGDAAGAEPVLAEAIAVYTRAHGERDRSVARARLELGRCLTRLGRFDEAERMLIDAHGVLSEGSSAKRDDVTKAVARLADLYGSWDAAAPGKGHDAKAVEWKSKADAPASGAPSTSGNTP